MNFYSPTNKTNSYFQGLQVIKKDTSLYAVGIQTGFFVPGEQKSTGWDPKYTYLNIDSTTALEITYNKDSLPRFDYIIAKPDYTKQFGNFRGLKFYCKQGELRKESNEETTPEFPDILNMDEILLGFIYNPGQGSSNDSSISILSVNNTPNTFAYETQPSDFRKSIVYSLQEWKSGVFYIKQQVVNYNLSLWYCKTTHVSSTFENDKDWYWEPITGSINQNDVINIVRQYMRPVSPQSSIQFNLDMVHFGGSENLLWNNSLQELFLNGVLTLKKQTSIESTPNEGEIKLYFEENQDNLILKVKIQNGNEYIISSFKSN